MTCLLLHILPPFFFRTHLPFFHHYRAAPLPMISPALPPEFPWPPSPSPSIAHTPNQTPFSNALFSAHHTSSKQPIDFSPPLIAMVVIAAAAFLIVTYSRLISRHFLPPLLRQIRRYRRWRRRRQLQIHRLPSSVGSATYSPPFASSDVVYSPYGLDESVIKSMPLSIFSEKNRLKGVPIDEFAGDCAVCLLEFVENDYVRTLPLCAHSFHVECIDIWLRSHATCPLCRAGVLPREWPFIPIMAARIRPSIEEGFFLDSIFLDPLPESPRRRSESVTTVPEIVPAPIENDASPAEQRTIQSESRLKRSYSFGFERNFASERLVTEAATTSPWRYHNRRGSFSFWRRPSPFSSLTKPRVFSFRSSRGMKSPLFGGRRRGGSFVPLSESASSRYAYYYSSSSAMAGSSRRSKSLASPMFGRSSAGGFSSSRMRCGDPEALISPERYGGR